MSLITIHFVFLFCLCFINSGPKVLIQERFQPIVKLHVARRFSTEILGCHLPEGLAIRPGIRAGPVVVIVPVPEHFQLLSVGPVSNAEVLI